MSFGNQFKTVILLACLTALLLWIGSFWGKSGLIFGLIFAVAINFGSYFYSDKIVLRMYRAKEIKESDAPNFYKVVKDVAHLANIPMPKVYIIPTTSLNAMATGRNPQHAAVACTQGILQALSRDELKGVIAHEVSHIKNRDILIQTIAATIAGVISYVAMMARWAAIFGGFGGRGRDSRGMELLALAIVTPLVAMLLQLALSRSREYLADESAAKMLHSPHGLVNALEKLHHGAKHNPMRLGSPSTSGLFIVNPFRASALLSLLSTHPPMEKRIQKLKSMDF